MLTLTPAARARLEAAAAQVFAGCPPAFLGRFAALAGAPSAELAASAELVLTKPYGRNHILETTGEFGLSFAVMNPGQTTSYHRHEQRRELFLVRRGSLTLRSGDAESVLVAGDLGWSSPPVAHALSNRSSDVLEFLEIFSPPLLDDKVRLSDPYRRPIGRVTVHQ